MVRIQHQSGSDGRVGVFSPDGRYFATVVWCGDSSRNLNVYSIVLFDLESPLERQRSLRKVLTWDFAGDPKDQHASPFQQLTFLEDNRTLAFIGRRGGLAAQVYSVDIRSSEVKQLTRHDTAVQSFVAGAEDALMFSAVAHGEQEAARQARMASDGVFLWDRDILVPNDYFGAGPLIDPAPMGLARQYFLQRGRDSSLVFDSRQGRRHDAELKGTAEGFQQRLHENEMLRRWETLTAQAQGRFALLFPYLPTDLRDGAGTDFYHSDDSRAAPSLATPYGLVDLVAGRVERFVDAWHPRNGGRPIWAPKGASVAIFAASRSADRRRNPDQSLQWMEVDLANREVTPLNVPSDWQVMGWGSSGRRLVVFTGNGSDDMRFALWNKHANGRWGELSGGNVKPGFNPFWRPATNGEVVIGVRDGLYTPPEFVSLNLRTGGTTVLSDLNPELHQRRYGTVEVFRWSHRYEREAGGFLVKPIGFKEGMRYPLIVLLDDGALSGVSETYLLDGVRQLNGHAVQMLAAQGFLVLYTREPRSLFAGGNEGERMRQHIESAVLELDRLQLIDIERVGLSGFSRAAYHTNRILMGSEHRFAAATQMDGGSVEYYLQGPRPFTDAELESIRTPILLEAHGRESLLRMTTMSDRLNALGRPMEVLYFATAPHSTTQPQHRRRSLETHLDWWRFWLQDEEDADPKKAEQYRHWRAMRDEWSRLATPSTRLSRAPPSRRDAQVEHE